MYMTADVANRTVTFSSPGTFLGSEGEQVANFVRAECDDRAAKSAVSKETAHVRAAERLARKMLRACVTARWETENANDNR
jgi:hypothetical protein